MLPVPPLDPTLIPPGPRLRLLALDIDGTLLDNAHNLDPRVCVAVQGLAAGGVQVVLASARSPRALRPVAQALGLAGLAVTFNGGLLCRLSIAPGTPDEVISEQRLPLDSARLLVARTLVRGISVGWFTGDDWHIPAWDDMLRREAGNLRLPPLVTPDLLRLAEAPHKIQCMIGDLAREADLHALSGELPPGVAGYFTHRDYLEVFPQGVEKAGGLLRLGGALGVAPAEMAAIGDGENDLGMLRAVGLAIAMDNALPAVKAAAQWVTASNEEAGVAVAIEALQRAGRF